jgi:hypothetical protein
MILVVIQIRIHYFCCLLVYLDSDLVLSLYSKQRTPNRVQYVQCYLSSAVEHYL